MAPINLKRKRSTERQPNHVDTPQAEGVNEVSQTVGVIRQRERIRRIRRSTGTGHIPSHDREVIGKVVDLWPPSRASIPHESLQQDKRRPFTRPLISDAQAPNLDL